MAVLKLSTPGVFVQEISTLPPSVAEVETAIPAFIGYTEKAERFAPGDLTMIPNKVTSVAEFEQFYGKAAEETDDSIFITVTEAADGKMSATLAFKETDPTNPNNLKDRSKFNLYYSIKHFYDNGGGVCFVVSVGDYKAAGAPVAAKLTDGLKAIEDIDEVTLLVVPEASKIDDPAATYPVQPAPPAPPVAPVPPAGYNLVVQAMIKQASDPKLRDRFALIDPFYVSPKSSKDPNGDIDTDVKWIRDATMTVLENRYAAAYYPNLVTAYAYNYLLDKVTVKEGPASVKGKKIKDLEGSALYNTIVSALGKLWVVLPPSPAMAGLYTRVDNTKGVWKSPANESVLATLGPNLAISNREQENLNVDPNSGKSINVIRTFPGFGTLVWGARTLNGNDNEWKYISVRRFFNMVEESVKKSCQWAVFEPNTIDTWVKVQSMIENYLFLKWREGALAGVKPEQAFYVKVGLGTTMTSLDILEGRMNVEIGMAVARPAEFIVLKFTQLLQQS
ncbi:phage tail sheath family protein [Flavihumibacter solisilvae]|uniref:Tail sheath protein C-terminal domain-containing protein n=1 Tax=Flavihumibacter solisilvae TaxID=1349421 RepID=A0A0C1L7B6_9BACT|nr:phage tail sheath C-terminal domain-containing protein [Flavihumibacter solisilvae]KIC95401.1 hypothetical protein OI18_05765 [Flavihumibacter solisilvae]